MHKLLCWISWHTFGSRRKKAGAFFCRLKLEGPRNELETTRRSNLALRVLCSRLLLEDDMGRSACLELAGVCACRSASPFLFSGG